MKPLLFVGRSALVMLIALTHWIMVSMIGGNLYGGWAWFNLLFFLYLPLIILVTAIYSWAVFTGRLRVAEMRLEIALLAAVVIQNLTFFIAVGVHGGEVSG